MMINVCFRILGFAIILTSLFHPIHIIPERSQPPTQRGSNQKAIIAWQVGLADNGSIYASCSVGKWFRDVWAEGLLTGA